jgi:hypothetical protein
MIRKKPALGLDPGVEAGFRKDHAQSKNRRQSMQSETMAR